ncbi:DUF2089 domain-containing protein [Weissella cibaria]|jgi:Uncharacterized protein conserved in bacteria|uniref:Uncharacterized protein n=2 Tax=Weissella cibaria TaxID=137591 RepID=A0A0D1LY67_9LACO|nr:MULTISPECIES: DUF2089 family protein [Weissella]APS27419.1 hypothetical protein AUC63_01419 [Weissella cibaria]APU62817.1 hypothetical protein AUC65_01025 [Weissella cibaria]APU64968.1 hypothetical protein AUC62_01018 [Weissella cibaria]ASS51657.1 hypothetical protein CHR48_00667 [Weissella cibaria]AVO65725.1 DUF2089 domain-containing protein [Weissella cibaria]
MEWFLELSTEDQEFVKQLVLSSGSLKQLAKIYDVSYPTVRTRLNMVIQTINLIDSKQANSFEGRIMKMVIAEKISLDVAKEIISDYREANK